MEKRKFSVTLLAACTLSAFIGIMLGFFVLGSIGVSATMTEPEMLSIGKPEYADYSIPTVTEYRNEPEVREAGHSFILGSKDGYIAVYYAGDTPEIKEMTFTPINALPIEEQERLAQGIHIYTEEALVRILEDYES
jgi:hypothetical protein